ncbi:MAG: hypothetical protein WAM72_17150 [Xanthobacteraceae bacterium]
MPREEARPDRSTNPAGSEFLNTLQEMRRDWMARATAEVELSLKLSKKLTDAHSIPDALIFHFRDVEGRWRPPSMRLTKCGSAYRDRTGGAMRSILLRHGRSHP